MDYPQLNRLLETLRTLRGQDGCPWDQQQTLASAARHLSDEVHEYADAAASGDLREVRAELADLFYMVCFNWLLLSEQQAVSLDDLAQSGREKLENRKPHVFGDEKAETVEDAQRIWRRQKALEGSDRPADDPSASDRPSDDAPGSATPSALKHLSPSTSPLRQALVYGSTAAETGFDWPDPEAVEIKLHEEIEELRHARAAGNDPASDPAVVDEFGDILFAAVQLGRKLGLDPDAALKGTNRKFARRFRHMEARAHTEGRDISDLTINEMFQYWEQSKLSDDPG